jgi:lysylphosphatidylglycerol synthetase-like protein (DUF2156 family)
MCHVPGAPNGLTDFLVVRAIELLRREGVAEVSLNFAAFARYLHAPASPRERWLGRAARRVDPFFQIESLYRYNAKFFPRWEPRYLLYEGGVAGFARTVLATLWVEGHLRRPRLRPPRAAPARRPVAATPPAPGAGCRAAPADQPRTVA